MSVSISPLGTFTPKVFAILLSNPLSPLLSVVVVGVDVGVDTVGCSVICSTEKDTHSRLDSLFSTSLSLYWRYDSTTPILSLGEEADNNCADEDADRAYPQSSCHVRAMQWILYYRDGECSADLSDTQHQQAEENNLDLWR